MSKRNIIIESISYLFVILFFYTGVSKLLDYKTFTVDWINSPLVKSLQPTLAFAVPIIELIVAIFLLFPKTKKIGLYSSLALMIAFTFYVGGILAFAKHKLCTCGGILRSLSWGQHLILNIVLTALALTAVLLIRKQDQELPLHDTKFTSLA